MGLTHVTVRVAALRPAGDVHEAELLVDTSAVDCLAPAKKALAAAGIRAGTGRLQTDER